MVTYLTNPTAGFGRDSRKSTRNPLPEGSKVNIECNCERGEAFILNVNAEGGMGLFMPARSPSVQLKIEDVSREWKISRVTGRFEGDFEYLNENSGDSEVITTTGFLANMRPGETTLGKVTMHGIFLGISPWKSMAESGQDIIESNRRVYARAKVELENIPIFASNIRLSAKVTNVASTGGIGFFVERKQSFPMTLEMLNLYKWAINVRGVNKPIEIKRVHVADDGVIIGGICYDAADYFTKRLTYL